MRKEFHYSHQIFMAEKLENIIDLLDRGVKLFPNNTLTLDKRNGKWESLTFTQVKQQARHFAAGLIKMGVKPGDRIALMSEGRREWLICELGMLMARAVNVPLSIKLNVEGEVSFRLAHSGARYLILSAPQAKRLADVGFGPEGITLIHLDNCEALSDGVATYDDIVNDGAEWLKNSDNAAHLDTLIASIDKDDMVNISYTSGTTSDPKGIMLTHGNYVSNTLQSASLVKISPNDVTLTILPWDHSFAHTTCLYCFIYYGATIASQIIGKTPMETLKLIPQAIKEVRPTLMMSVPALSKAFRKNIESGVKAKGDFAWKMFEFFRKNAYAYNKDYFHRGSGLSFLRKPLVWLGDKILMSKIRENFGGRLQYFIGGGALLDVELQRFFMSVGIPIFQGYGLSEASPVISSNVSGRAKFGSSGTPVKFMDITICDADGKVLPNGEKGEIVIKGGNVMKGYWKNETATQETIVDGWLHTGDMGYMDPDGFLQVLGRFKSLLISSDGEKYSPEGIEESIVELSPIIDQCMLYNNQSPYTIALIVPNASALKARLEEHGHGDLSKPENQKIATEMLWNEICQMRKGGKYAGLHPERWLPATMGVLSEGFTEANHLLNSTMKMVRPKVCERYADLIDFLMTTDGKNICSDRNLESISKL